MGALRARYQGRALVVYGRSLGTGLAAGLSAELSAAGRAPALTMLVSPYTSLQALARDAYPWVPAALLRYPMDTATLLPRVQGAVLLVHGARDTLIPPRHAQLLQQARPGTRLELLPRSGHNDLQDDPQYERILLGALAQL